MIDMEYLRKLRTEAKRAPEMARRSGLVVRGQSGSEKKGDAPYSGATFLYIRAFDDDDGARPIPSGTVFWLSPDVELYDSAGLQVMTTDIIVNKTYTVKVTVRNNGLERCDTCNVELYLDDPFIGFSIAASTLIGVKTATVAGQGGFAIVEFPFVANNGMAGHKCMFARAYSLTSNDYPADLANLDAANDRHTGQQNLNIVKQNTRMAFCVQLPEMMKEAELTLAVRTDAKIGKVTAAPILGKYFVRTTGVDLSAFQIDKRAPAEGARSQLRRGQVARRSSSQAMSSVTLRRLSKAAWATKMTTVLNEFEIAVPALNLETNEAVPMHLVATDTRTGKTLGGVSLLIVK